jgi:hypothetical protein
MVKDLEVDLRYLQLTLEPGDAAGLERLHFFEGTITKAPYQIGKDTYVEVLDSELDKKPLGMLVEFVVGARGKNENFIRAYRDTPENREVLDEMAQSNKVWYFFKLIGLLSTRDGQFLLERRRRQLREIKADKKQSEPDPHTRH